MSTHNIHFCDKIKKICYPYFLFFFFIELSEEFPRDSKMGSNQPW